MTAATPPAHPSQGEWDALGQKLNAVPDQANRAVTAIFNLVNEVLGQWWCPAWVGDWIKPILDKLVELVQAILRAVKDQLIGFMFPLIALFVANDWNDQVKNPVNKVNGEVSDANLHVGDYWQGTAATAYSNAVTAQTNAMTEVATIVGDLQVRLWVIAGVLFSFYVALGVILAQWIAVMFAATAADATGVGAILGIPVAVGDTTVSGGAIAAAVGALVAIVVAEAQSYTTLNGRTTSSAKFPNGHWPKAVTDVLDDASEKDGDDTQWHLKY